MTIDIKRWSDGSYAKVGSDGSWALKLANAKVIRGRESDPPEAFAMVEQLHNDYVLQRWSKGVLRANGLLEVPLR